MVARNEITGDKIQSKINENENFDKGYGEIDWSIKMDVTPPTADKPMDTAKTE
jgi:hypothetical protein